MFISACKYPSEVDSIPEAASQKLGRQAVMRQVKNQEEWKDFSITSCRRYLDATVYILQISA